MTEEEFREFIKYAFVKNNNTNNYYLVILLSDISQFNDDQRAEFLNKFQNIKKDEKFSFSYSLLDLIDNKLSENDIDIINKCMDSANNEIGFLGDIELLLHKSFKLPDHIFNKLYVSAI
jgi:hypothetical protein